MNFMQEIEERVAAGLRRCQTKPAALLFVDDIEDWTYDSPECCGLPVYHTSCLSPPNDDGCLFVPLWLDDDNHVLDVARFWDGYCEW